MAGRVCILFKAHCISSAFASGIVFSENLCEETRISQPEESCKNKEARMQRLDKSICTKWPQNVSCSLEALWAAVVGE